MQTTRVFGRIRRSNGDLSSGAVIKVYRNTTVFYQNDIIVNAVLTTSSNSYGQFYIDLTPTSGDEFYTIVIQDDVKTTYNVKVPYSLLPTNIINLEKVVPRGKRVPMLGGGYGYLDSYGNLIPVDFGIGLIIDNGQVIGGNNLSLAWFNINGNGAQSVFTAPGTIYTVVLNGIVQAANLNYTQTSPNTIEVSFIPAVGDILMIQYGVS